MNLNARYAPLLVASLLAVACSTRGYVPAPLTTPDAQAFLETGPDSFDVEMLTTKGPMIIRVRRHWAPNGADRFHALTRNHYFDSVAFHRTIRGFVAQFGIHGDPAVAAAWRNRNIPDDTVQVVNQRGTMSFARAGANTRSVQLFFNLVDNTPRLDTLNAFGFPPLGQVVRGLEVLDALNTEYSTPVPGGAPVTPPSQDSLTRQGNAYLARRYPRLDYILTARVIRSWR